VPEATTAPPTRSAYDAANDRLTGVYDQVVVKQKFDVVFVRDKS
jgi:hypothetical protein